MHCMRRSNVLASRAWLLVGSENSAAIPFRLQCVITSSASSGADLSGDAKPFEDIPGPNGPPFFGTYLKYKLGIIDIPKLLETLKRWHQQYGGVVKETLLGQTHVHVFDPKAVRTWYANEDKWPYVVPLAETSKMYRNESGISPGLGNSNDEQWYHLRSGVQQLLMRPKKVTPFLPGMDTVALDFIDHLKGLRDDSNQVPNFATELGKWSLESSGVHCFNKRLGFLTDKGKREAEELLAANRTMFDLTTQLTYCLPLHKYFTTPKWKRVFAAEDKLYKFMEKHFDLATETIQEKMKTGELRDEDFLFLRFLLSRTELRRSEAAILTLSLLIDPLSTTVSQLQFLLYLLAVNPKVQEKLQEEIATKAPPYPAPLTADYINNLSYLKACFKESVRMLPMPNEIRRRAKKDMLLGGYHIPADTVVYLHSEVLFRHPDYFSKPDTYLPERWLRGAEEKSDPIIVQPFGHGPRMCIGRRFAEQETAVVLSRLLQNFHVEWHHAPMGLRYMTLNVPDCPAQYTFLDR